jgi:hypothetical protein
MENLMADRKEHGDEVRGMENIRDKGPSHEEHEKTIMPDDIPEITWQDEQEEDEHDPIGADDDMDETGGEQLVHEEEIYEKSIDGYLEDESKNMDCMEQVAYVLREIERRIKQRNSRIEPIKYRILPDERRGEEGKKEVLCLESHELLPQFSPKYTRQNEQWMKERKDADPDVFFYQSVGPEINPVLGDPTMQWWNWGINVVVETLPWKESPSRLKELWEIKWGEYKEVVRYVGECAGWWGGGDKEHKEDEEHKEEKGAV